MKKLIFTVATILATTGLKAQNAAINSTGASPNASAMLDVASTTKGLLTPRMTSAQRTAISSPATGLIVYQTDGTDGFYYYDGSAWVLLINGTDALPAVNGSAVTNLNASNLASGTVPTARLGSGTADNSTYLRGDGTWSTPSSGSTSPTFLTKTANYTITASDVSNNLVLTSNSGSTRTYTIPTAASVTAGKTITISSQGVDFDITRSGSDTFNGIWGNGSTSISTLYVVQLMSNGSNAWVVISGFK